METMLTSFSVGGITVRLHFSVRKPSTFSFSNYSSSRYLNHSLKASAITIDAIEGSVSSREGRFIWLEMRPDKYSEQQKEAISLLPRKMTNRCKALMRQLITFSPEKGALADVFKAWVRIMKPRRTDWLVVLKTLQDQNSPFHLEVCQIALLEESFEANIRDYTKLIHFYGKQGNLREAETLLSIMEKRGFECDQVTLTTLVHMYSKAGNLIKAEEVFGKLKVLNEALDGRSYGAMVMAYIRGGLPTKGEEIIKEMDGLDMRAGREVYKALLRCYAMAGDFDGAQRVFDAIQMAGIPPDERICGLLINAYEEGGETEKARGAFENMRKVGIMPNDKCVGLMLKGFQKENRVEEAMSLLGDLERDGYVIGREPSEILAKWLSALGVVDDVELALRRDTTV